MVVQTFLLRRKDCGKKERNLLSFLLDSKILLDLSRIKFIKRKCSNGTIGPKNKKTDYGDVDMGIYLHTIDRSYKHGSIETAK